MSARKSILSNVPSITLTGAVFALFSISAAAQPSAKLDSRAPLPATLLPEMRVTASVSNPHLAPSWSLAPSRPLPVTLMPTLTVSADVDALAVVTLPTVTVYASVDQDESDQAIELAAAAMPGNMTFQLAN